MILGRCGLILCTLLALSGTVEANMRPAWLVDGAWSSSVDARSSIPGLTLTAEALTVGMPQISTADFDPLDNFAQVVAHYRFELKGKARALPIRFLAPSVSQPIVRVNGELVAVDVVQHSRFADQKDLLSKLADHRYKWTPDRYRRFFEILEVAAYGEMTHGKLKHAPPKTAQDLDAQSYSTFAMLSGYEGAEYFTFEALFRPGSNQIIVEYQQRLSADEVVPHSGDFRFEKAHLGFDYLLYPALNWERSPDFTLNVEIWIPDFLQRRWFVNRRKKAKIESSIPLQRHREEGGVFLRGEYSDFPAEILSVTIQPLTDDN